MSKVGYRCPFCPKVRFTRCCPALRFLAKITCAHHVFAQFSCKRARLAVHEQGRVPMPVLPVSPFYTMLPRAAFFGQNHMRAPCFRPVLMYMSKVRCPWIRSGTDARFARKSVLHDVAPRCVFWPKSHARTMFSPSFHVHEQGELYMSKGGCRCPFCPKVRFTRCCPALCFLAKITCAHHVFAQFSCT